MGHAVSLVRLFCVALLVAVPEQARAQAPDFNAVVSQLSDAIASESRGLVVKPSVVVTDLVESHGHSTGLGVELAREFDVSGASGASSESALDAAANCSAGRPKPTFIVDGSMDELQDGVVIRLRATRTEDHKAIFDERVTVPLTPQLQALEAKPPSAAEKPSGEGGPDWVRPGFHLPDHGANVVSMDAVDNYTPPRCLECARAEYPDSAMAAKIQGVIHLRILVDASGQPAEIAILKGLPCGLNERAIETVATWRFEPAKGPDGKPQAVWQNAQLSFQLSN
jgi:TonB family protein